MTSPIGSHDPVVAVIGGSGKLGKALARRLLKAGYSVTIGSRSSSTAEDAARSLTKELHLSEHALPRVFGMSNEEAARSASLVILAIPSSSYDVLLPPLQEACAAKIVLSTAVPFPLRDTGMSAGEHAQELLPAAHVIAGLHTVSHVVLEGDSAVNEDALLVGNDPNDVALFQEVLASIPGLRAVYGGSLRFARITESLTHLLIQMNRTYHATTGIQITGINPD
ncbi:MAG: NADPH-dependent F420 reductase [Candidatus Dormibacteria bacterium]